jgi:hypothetical protein
VGPAAVIDDADMMLMNIIIIIIIIIVVVVIISTINSTINNNRLDAVAEAAPHDVCTSRPLDGAHLRVDALLCFLRAEAVACAEAGVGNLGRDRNHPDLVHPAVPARLQQHGSFHAAQPDALLQPPPTTTPPHHGHTPLSSEGEEY